MIRKRRDGAATRSKLEWLANVQGHQVGDYVLDKYIGCGKIGYVYRAHLNDIPDVVHAVKLIPKLREGWETELKKVAKLSTALAP